MYRTTDLAEIVNNPSPVTRRYLDAWFTGSGSYGRALTMLGWPVTAADEPLLVWDEKHGLRVDTGVEERIMYGATIFSYTRSGKTHNVRVDLRKLSPSRLFNTMKVVLSHSALLTNHQHTYDRAKRFVEDMSIHPPDKRSEIETVLADVVWPRVIAVDYIGEYILSILLHGKSDEECITMLTSIQTKARDMDWYTRAMLAWSEYQEGRLSERTLLSEYGYAAGDDYELTKPRYYERLHKPKPTIDALPVKHMQIKTLEDLAVGMHYLRSEVKRRSLVWIAALREALISDRVIGGS